MSSFHKVTSDIRDQRSLTEALTLMGYEGVESHEQAVQLTNAWGEGHGVSTAEVVVRAKAVKAKHKDLYRASDVGFKRQEDGTFALQANDMDSRTFSKEWLGRVKTAVGTARTIRMARMKYGCTKPQITEKVVNGRPKTVLKFLIP